MAGKFLAAAAAAFLAVQGDAFVAPRANPLRPIAPLFGADDAMLETYDSLAARVMETYEKKKSELRNEQLFVCVAGGPGSGKSTLSEAVADRVNEKMPVDPDCECPPAVVLPMDGFHYTRAQLKAIGESDDNDYTFDDLIERRGSPWTFDAEQCVEMFTTARMEGEASLPTYSREKSDPVDGGVKLDCQSKIVFLEGNYLLAWDDERWAPLKGIFDETWYIACKDLQDQRQRLVSRHLETWSDAKTEMFGAGEEGAGKKADSNDMKNLVWIDEKSKEHADLFIESIG